MTETHVDTKKKIIEAAAYLFGANGYDGTSTREIGRLAGVNISSLNYHFKSKQNLMDEVAGFACDEFQTKLEKVAAQNLASTAEFALSLYNVLLEDGSKCLNQFKLFLNSKTFPDNLGEHPFGFEQLSIYLNKDLNPKVPHAERLWVNNIFFSYLLHTAVMSMTHAGKQHIDKFMLGNNDINKDYIRQLIETLVRDLNNRYQ
jgi:AcrR family transcriptional regulator